jgi:hypothetical protein
LSEDKQVRVSIYLTEDKRARFKSACALYKKSMNEVLLDFIDDFLEQKQLPAPSTSAKGTGDKGKGE